MPQLNKVFTLALYLLMVSTTAFSDTQGQQQYAFIYPTDAHPTTFIQRLLQYTNSAAATASRQGRVVPVEKYFSAESEALLGAQNAQRLSNLAATVEQHNWALASSYFPAQHIEMQLDMYLHDTFMFKGMGKPKQRDLEKALNLYIGENLGLYMVGKAIDDINDIKRLRYTGVTIEPPALNNAYLSLVVTLEDGTEVLGELSLNLKTGSFTPAAG